MKFSFESGKYRAELADKLIQKRSSGDRNGAFQFLNKERKTKRYHFSKIIKHIQQKNPTNHEKNEERFAKLEVEEIDISRDIPEEIQLRLDEYRLNCINERHKEGIQFHPSSGEPDQDEEEILKARYPNTYGMSLDELESFDYEKGNFLTSTEPHFIGNIGLELNSWEFLLEQAKLAKEQRKAFLRYDDDPATCASIERARDFVNEITEGDLYKNTMLTHVVGGWTEEFPVLKERYPHSTPEIAITENPLNIYNSRSSQLWFNPGKPVLFKPEKIILICDSQSTNFQQKVERFEFYRSDEKTKRLQKLPLNELMLLPEAKTSAGGIGGICVYFKESENWTNIAKWIVDLYHGRLYRITQKHVSTSDT